VCALARLDPPVKWRTPTLVCSSQPTQVLLGTALEILEYGDQHRAEIVILRGCGEYATRDF
jgi:hypothetical protein